MGDVRQGRCGGPLPWLNLRHALDACKPFTRRDSFPVVARSGRDLDAKIRAKWAEHLPKER